MTSLKVEIYPDRATAVERSRVLIVERLQAAAAERGAAYLALAGGSTPKPLYEALAKEELPLDKLHIFWGDERYVPSDHADSNAGMAKAAWFDQVPLPSEQIHITPTDAKDPADAAKQYEQTLREVMSNDEWPQFDVILLGIGDDGHTASLFPHTPALNVSDRFVTVGDKDGTPRITFTAPFINHSRCVIFLVAGSNKQTALTQVLAEEGDDMAYPSRLIRPQGELFWLLDAGAGEPIKNHPNAQVF